VTCVPLEGHPFLTCVDDTLLGAFGVVLILAYGVCVLVMAFEWVREKFKSNS
jgi:uncharacterized membrane protein SirB2